MSEKTISLDNLSTFKQLTDTLYGSNLAPEYDATATYELDDICTYQGKLYRCTTVIAVAEAWTPAHWTIQNVEEMLHGKFVRIIDAPESTTLTDEQINIIKEGVFVNGDFLMIHNPVFFPGKLNRTETDYYGAVMGDTAAAGYSQNFRIYTYYINISTKKISLANNSNPWISISVTDGALSLYSGQSLTINTRDGIQLSNIRLTNAPSGTPDGHIYAPKTGYYTAGWCDIGAMIAPYFDSTATYALGALVIHNGILYKCTTAVETAGDWNASDWTQTTLAEVNPTSLGYLTTAPTANNTDGIKIVVLSSEPATRYDGYLYIITGSNQ